MSSLELFDTSYTTEQSIKELSSQLDEPKWLLDRRLKSYENYKKLPFDKDTLFYKYTTFRNFDPKNLTPSWQNGGKSTINQSAIAMEELEPHLIETPSGLSSRLPEELIEKGVVLDSLHNLIDRDEKTAKEIMKKTSFSEGFDKLGSLSAAFSPNITVLYVPKNTKITKPLVKVNFIGEGATANFSEFLAVFDDFSDTTFINVFQRSKTKSKDDQLFGGMETIYVGENSKARTMQIQDWDRSVLHLMSKIAKLKAYANFKTLSVLQGGYMSRLNSQLDLDGNGSEGYDLFSSFGDGKQRFDVKSELHHNGRDAIGQTHARQVMMDKSESILRGLIVIPESGVNADSWLTSQGMTINKGKVTAIPALKIDQNDVKAAHAASVEPLNDELLFYLESRGIREKTAREMIVKGYFEYVLKLFEDIEGIEISRKYIAKKWDIAQE